MRQSGAVTPAMASPVPTPRFLVLDSLRGICAVMVVLFHLKATGTITQLALVRNSWLFVDFFFVLSGFVIATGYQERLAQGFPLRRFMFLRLARVYPLHIFVLLLFLAFETLKLLEVFPAISLRPAFAPPRAIPELWENVFLVQIFGLRDYDSWNGPAWSIAAEVWTYLLAGLVFVHARRLVVPIAAITVVAALAALLVTGNGHLDRTFSMALVRCLLGFSCGVIACNLYRRFGPLRSGTALEIATAAGVTLFVTLASGWGTLAAPFVFFAAVLVFASEGGRVSAGLRWRPFVLLGTLSYSIYMLHTFVLARCVDLLLLISRRTGVELGHLTLLESGLVKRAGNEGHAWIGDALTILMVVVCIGAAWCTFHLVEEPFRKWSKRRVKAAVARAEQAPVAF